MIATKTDFDILKSRNIPDTLFKAIVEICTQHEILIKCDSKLSKLAEIKNRLCHFPSLAYSV